MLNTSDDNIIFESTASGVNIFCRDRDESSSETLNTTMEIIEIPAHCVEYIGRILTETAIPETSPSNWSDTSNPSETRLREPLSREDTAKNGPPTSFVEIQIHICECVSVFTCCIVFT